MSKKVVDENGRVFVEKNQSIKDRGLLFSWWF